jgi:hypothetical protein
MVIVIIFNMTITVDDSLVPKLSQLIAIILYPDFHQSDDFIDARAGNLHSRMAT